MSKVREYLGIQIDYERDKLLPEQGLAYLTKPGFYKTNWERSPQETFARGATSYCFGDYEFAQRIYDYASKKHFTFASPVLSNAIELAWPEGLPFDMAGDWLEEHAQIFGLPISCFEAGTPVFTEYGEKPIETLVKGDKVLTHKGRFRRVLATKNSVSSDIYYLKIDGLEVGLRVTGNHLILSDHGWERVDSLVKTMDRVAVNREIEGGFQIVKRSDSGIDMEDGLTYYTISELYKLEGRESTVYDIQVEEDESFSAGGVVVHNCFLNHIDDSKEGLVKTMTETAWLSMMGGGVGTYMGQRSPDERSTGVIKHSKVYDAITDAFRQTRSRRGSIAVYDRIDSPEIASFIDMRTPMGGDANSKCFNLNHGLCIDDKFMEAVILNEEYELQDVKHGATGRFINARETWDKIMNTRFTTGEPYLLWIDTVNRNIPDWITNPHYHVSQSNLCT